MRTEIATLDRPVIAERAPATYSIEPAQNVSQRYGMIKTSEVIDLFAAEGWTPRMATQVRARNPERQATNKHLIRFTNSSLPVLPGDSEMDILLINAHNRSSAFFLFAGVFRVICANGLVVCDSLLGAMRFAHTPEVVDALPKTIAAYSKDRAKLAKRINAYSKITLSDSQRLSFAQKASELHRIALPHEQLLTVRREEDRKPDLRTTFNVVQENLTGGGVEYKTTQGRSSTTRPIRAIRRNTQVNTALWDLTEQLYAEAA